MSSLLLCSTPVHGHVTPLLAVARHLVASGHRVRFLTGRRYRDAVEATGAEWLALPDEADFDDSDVNASFPGRVGRSGPDGIRWDMREIFLKPAPAQLAAVDAAIAAEPVDAIIVETMFIGSLLFLARGGERPPLITLGIVPLGVRSRDTAPFGLGVRPMPGPVGRLRNRVLGFVAGNIIFGPVQKDAVAHRQGGHRRRPHRAVPRIVGARRRARAVHGAVVRVPAQRPAPARALRRSRLTYDRIHLGSCRSGGTTSTSGTPVVHVTQGTVANADFAELIDPTIEGLADEDVLVVVSTGGREVPDRSYPANVRIAPYLPYDRLLPLTDVYVTNGGYGGVHYAMEHGVPIVVAGRTEDKVEVSARVAWSGVGIDLRSNRPTSAAVRDRRCAACWPSPRSVSAAPRSARTSWPRPASTASRPCSRRSSRAAPACADDGQTPAGGGADTPAAGLRSLRPGPADDGGERDEGEQAADRDDGDDRPAEGVEAQHRVEGVGPAGGRARDPQHPGAERGEQQPPDHGAGADARARQALGGRCRRVGRVDRRWCRSSGCSSGGDVGGDRGGGGHVGRVAVAVPLVLLVGRRIECDGRIDAIRGRDVDRGVASPPRGAAPHPGRRPRPSGSGDRP